MPLPPACRPASVGDGIGAAALGEGAAAVDAHRLVGRRQAAAAQGIGAAAAGVAAQVEIDEAGVAAGLIKGGEVKGAAGLDEGAAGIQVDSAGAEAAALEVIGAAAADVLRQGQGIDGVGAAALGKDAGAGGSRQFHCPPTDCRPQVVGAAGAAVVSQHQGRPIHDMGAAGLGKGAGAGVADGFAEGRQEGCRSAAQGVGAAAAGIQPQGEVAADVLVPPVWVKLPVPLIADPFALGLRGCRRSGHRCHCCRR